MILNYPDTPPRDLRHEVEAGDIIWYRLNERVAPVMAKVLEVPSPGSAVVVVLNSSEPYTVEAGEWHFYEPCPLHTQAIHLLGFADDEEETEWGWCVHHFHLATDPDGCHYVLAREPGRWALYACREKDGEAVCDEYSGFWNAHELQQLLRLIGAPAGDSADDSH